MLDVVHIDTTESSIQSLCTFILHADFRLPFKAWKVKLKIGLGVQEIDWKVCIENSS